jgi:hypothetical protein
MSALLLPNNAVPVSVMLSLLVNEGLRGLRSVALRTLEVVGFLELSGRRSR